MMKSNSQESLDDIVVDIHMLAAKHLQVPHPMGCSDVVCSELNFFRILYRYTVKHVIGKLDIVRLVFNKYANYTIYPQNAYLPDNYMIGTVKLNREIICRIGYLVIQLHLGAVSTLTLKCYRIDLTGTRNFEQFQLLIINPISDFKNYRAADPCTVQGDSSITE